MSGGSGHLRILVEPFSDPGFLGSRGGGGAAVRGSRLGEWVKGGGSRLGGKRKDGRLKVKNSGGVGTGGGNSLGKDFKDFGPVGGSKLLKRGALSRGKGRHGGLSGGLRLTGGDDGGRGGDRDRGTR